MCSATTRASATRTGGTRPVVALRDASSYSVILGVFRNEGYDQAVTLAQVFWLKDPQGQPARLFVVAERVLSIADDFAGFGSDITALRKSCVPPAASCSTASRLTAPGFVGALASSTSRRWSCSTRRCR